MTLQRAPQCIGAALLALALLAAPVWAAPPFTIRDPGQHFFETTLGDLRGELAAGRQQGKHGVLLVFEMEDCPYCHRMKQTILNRSDVQDLFRGQFTVVRIDIRGDAPIEDFNGRLTTEKEFAQQQRIAATPTFIFYDLDGKPVVRFPGVARDAAEFMLLGQYVVDGAFRNSSFSNYRQQRSGK